MPHRDKATGRAVAGPAHGSPHTVEHVDTSDGHTMSRAFARGASPGAQRATPMPAPAPRPQQTT
ncbi:hypothetical protein [Sinomonas cyclohexanicum]|nr:hypothetical protein [Corynebacterium cyclohexanicum]